MRRTRPPACDLASATKPFAVFMDLERFTGDLYKKVLDQAWLSWQLAVYDRNASLKGAHDFLTAF